jgi:hypothetical protein
MTPECESPLAVCTRSNDGGALDNNENGKQPLSLVERTTTDIKDTQKMAEKMKARKTFSHQPLDLTKDSIRLIEILTLALTAQFAVASGMLR